MLGTVQSPDIHHPQQTEAEKQRKIIREKDKETEIVLE